MYSLYTLIINHSPQNLVKMQNFSTFLSWQTLRLVIIYIFLSVLVIHSLLLLLLRLLFYFSYFDTLSGGTIGWYETLSWYRGMYQLALGKVEQK